jgi:small subunit ribosomal protein S27e
MAQKFWRVECGECGNRQKTFSRASTEVDCQVCGEPIARPRGGTPVVNGEIADVLEVE